MTTPLMETTPTKPDPKRPYKAYAAAVGAGLTEILNANLPLPRYVELAMTVVASGIAAFLIPNPKKRPRVPSLTRKDQRMGPRRR